MSKQRHDYKLRQRGTSGRLTDERYKLLKDIGFVWEAGKGDKSEAEAPPQYPPKFDDGRSKDSSRRSSSSSRTSPQQSTASTSHDPSYRPLPPQQQHDIGSTLAHHAYANQAALMQAASMNHTKLQLAGLFPAASVGSGVRVPPGGLLAMSIPGPPGISYIPVVVQNYGVPHMAQPPPMVFHSVPAPPHAPPYQPPSFPSAPPSYQPMVPHTGPPHPQPHMGHMGAPMFHGPNGAVVQKPPSGSDEAKPPQQNAETDNRGADPPEG